MNQEIRTVCFGYKDQEDRGTFVVLGALQNFNGSMPAEQFSAMVKATAKNLAQQTGQEILVYQRYELERTLNFDEDTSCITIDEDLPILAVK